MVEFYEGAWAVVPELQHVQQVPAQGNGLELAAIVTQVWACLPKAHTHMHRLARRACLKPPHKTAPAWRGAAPAVHPGLRWPPEPCPPALHGSRQRGAGHSAAV